MIKRFSIIFICAFIALSPCFSFYNFSYAEEEEDTEWTWLIDMEEEAQRDYMVGSIKAFMAVNRKYLKFTYGVQQIIANWTYDKFNKLAQAQGYSSLNDYYYQVAYSNRKGIQRFFYTSSGLKLMDDLTKALLLEYGIDMALEDTERIYSGESFIDQDGNECLIYINNVNQNQFSLESDYLTHVQVGSPYRFVGNQYFSSQSTTNVQQLTIGNQNNNNTKTYYIKTFIDYKPDPNRPSLFYNSVVPSDNNNLTSDYSSYQKAIYLRPSTNAYSSDGNLCIIKNLYYNKYYLGTNSIYNFSGNSYWNLLPIIELTDLITESENIDLESTGEPKDDLSKYKSGIIAIEQGIKNIQELLDAQEPEAEPKETDGNVPPVTNTNINVGVVNNSPINIELPDLNDLVPDSIPSLPHSFSIPGLRYKFPFCIPFDMIAVYEVLDAEPLAPHFETEINFATFNYDLVIDLEDYNPYMVHIRNFFLILYIFGLLFITPKLLKA